MDTVTRRLVIPRASEWWLRNCCRGITSVLVRSGDSIRSIILIALSGRRELEGQSAPKENPRRKNRETRGKILPMCLDAVLTENIAPASSADTSDAERTSKKTRSDTGTAWDPERRYTEGDPKDPRCDSGPCVASEKCGTVPAVPTHELTPAAALALPDRQKAKCTSISRGPSVSSSLGAPDKPVLTGKPGGRSREYGFAGDEIRLPKTQ
ncbi:hypothetical protein B0H13DRAFT_1898826 [Mycena leptocephala]|nr:hypothetical protein B0H13DRAFT_1898826 [Mycena leptocephala]